MGGAARGPAHEAVELVVAELAGPGRTVRAECTPPTLLKTAAVAGLADFPRHDVPADAPDPLESLLAQRGEYRR